jgi:hypothetical protein
MNKEFIPYEQALELKELGFNEPCYYGYNFGGEITNKWDIGLVPAPLYQQAFRWFREKHGLDYEITYAGKKGEYHAFSVEYIYGNNGNSPSIFSYEEAELECLKKLIIIVERKPEAYS